ncbi:helix-turn-helix transcriptional regulator [Frateuria terrea]|uniref:Transcriptional regulator, AlpA family n=1 Tax=Frateuria terrea TaxID=529704 RepID=A0A1H6UKG2_9GAMM|nr:AlpA family transcriptional regulator [Frateuria terrea]SEI92833.1 transcriptional regulator, AlpA family [Frateuria terrea]SFP35100.1 transcriptional regulator, AlpA family [Frateuria terrea]
MTTCLLRLREVERRVGLGRTAIYQRITSGTFPRPVKLGTSSLWVDSEIEAWVSERIRERDLVDGWLAGKALKT